MASHSLPHSTFICYGYYLATRPVALIKSGITVVTTSVGSDPGPILHRFTSPNPTPHLRMGPSNPKAPGSLAVSRSNGMGASQSSYPQIVYHRG